MALPTLASPAFKGDEMNEYITITKTSPDKLTRQEWRFWFYLRKTALILDRYTLYKRETKRHKFGKSSIVKSYARTFARDCTISADEVPLDSGIAEEARKKFIDKIIVARNM